ncbi:AAA domain-containing protein [Dysgonomonas sp. 511]|uniref:AAA domain-containing protein n=1 Tax=Dysgonomonas sp. 511 TaxID=2302930 RepID=UPI0013D4E361|nr:AAA domain-containing protein [Dysgonomonas sp. 511]NDV79749.1 hypothetical protein [Dysgonomonas sp. 511]
MPEKSFFILSDYRSELDINDKAPLPTEEKYIRLRRILEQACIEITAGEIMQFSSLFSRIVFICQKYGVPKKLEWQLHTIRIKVNQYLRGEKKKVYLNQYLIGKDTVEQFLLFMEGQGKEEEDKQPFEEWVEVADLIDRIRVQVTHIDKSAEVIECQSDTYPGEMLKVKYNVPSANSDFNHTINQLWIGAQLNLLDVKKDEQKHLVPKSFVLEPDYLIDASAIAECFQQYGVSHYHYFLRKFEPDANSQYLLLGNLANFFLDQLIYAEDIGNLTFDDVFLKSFKAMPFEYASCSDISDNASFKDFMAKARTQFNNIKRVVREDMPAGGFKLEECILEPSFFSEKYGFQGRLDLLQPSYEKRGADRIIELKSGKLPYPASDKGKIAPNHEAQTEVYRMMIQSVSDKDGRYIYPSILYSAATDKGENIRFAAKFQKLEKIILNIRNLVVATEYKLYTGSTNRVRRIFSNLLDPNNYGSNLPSFFSYKIEPLQKALEKATITESLYFFRYVSFIAREMFLQKAGDQGADSSISISSLWTKSFAERKEAMELIADLEIKQIDDSGNDMVIYFAREANEDSANFRTGEICILYPHDTEQDTVLTHQIMKGTVVKISSSEVVLRFRYKQRNRDFFSRYRYWAVEHDKLDHSYNAMFKNLAAFMSAKVKNKELLLGQRQPVSTYQQAGEKPATQEQKLKTVLDKAMAARDYFLIAGPPGTGKTSIYARKLIEMIYAGERSNILIMAYTNRAVDELCASICSAFGQDEALCDKFIRIGTELSSGENYRHRLLQNISGKVANRKELLDTINNTRIFIGTLASITGKPEIFGLKHFDVAIIDEASQILEPQIIGLLPKVDKFIMIGDQKQLSTITLQSEDKAKVIESRLNRVELYDCNESLFERLFRICQKNEWTNAYDTLTYHGRMHEDIARLVNGPFYNNELVSATQRQLIPLPVRKYDLYDPMQALVANRRVAFIPSREVEVSNLSDKTNHSEAQIAVDLAIALLNIYKANGIEFDGDKTLGIITPFRNQVALIRQKLELSGIPELQNIMIDTVERYQGSQREVIIISFCFNRPYQLENFIKMNNERTVDRKLNVALTRAREQLFIIGNDFMLMQHPLYRQLLESITS